MHGVKVKGVFALLLPLDFQYLNANVCCCPTYSVKQAERISKNFRYKALYQNQSNGSGERWLSISKTTGLMEKTATDIEKAFRVYLQFFLKSIFFNIYLASCVRFTSRNKSRSRVKYLLLLSDFN
jgi:hypothetical protein